MCSITFNCSSKFHGIVKFSVFEDDSEIGSFQQYVRDTSKTNWDVLNTILLLMDAYVFIVGGSYLARRHQAIHTTEQSVVLLLAEDLKQDFDYLHDMEEKALLEFKISQGLKVFTKYNYQLTIQDNRQQVKVPASEMWYQMIMFQQNPAIKNFMICTQN